MYEPTFVSAAPNTNCVIPCPSVVYNAEEWDTLQNVLFVGSLCALIASLVAFLSHVSEFYRYYIRIMFIGGFLVSSVIVFFFAVMNRDNRIVCTDDNAAFIQRGPICIFQACASIFVFTWIELWSLILAYDSYKMVQNREFSLYTSTTQHMTQKMKLYKIYTLVAVFVCTVLTVIPLIADNYGFDPLANVPICLFLFSTNSTYFWTVFFLPFTILVLGCIYFSILGICQIQSIFVNSSNYFGNGIHHRTVTSPSGSDRVYSGQSSYVLSHEISNTGNTSYYHQKEKIQSLSDDVDTQKISNKLRNARDSIGGFEDTEEDILQQVKLESQFHRKHQSMLPSNSNKMEEFSQESYRSNGSGGDIRLNGHVAARHPSNVLTFSQTSQISTTEIAIVDMNTGREQPSLVVSPLTATEHMHISKVFLLSPDNSASNSFRYSEPLLSCESSAANSVQNSEHILTQLTQATAGSKGGYMYSSSNAKETTPSTLQGANNNHIYIQKKSNNLLEEDIHRLSVEDDSFDVGIGEAGREMCPSRSLTQYSLSNASSENNMKKSSFSLPGTEGEDVMNPLPTLNRGLLEDYNQHSKNTLPRNRTESSQSNETVSIGGNDMDVDDQSSVDTAATSRDSTSESVLNMKRNAKKAKRSVIKNTRDRILHMLTNNETIAQTIKYNGRAIIFVFLFCLTTLYIIPLLAELQYFQYPKFTAGTADFISCLMTASSQSQINGIPQTINDVSNYANDICGDIPSVRPQLGLMISAICWYAAYGIIPALVFGAGSYMVDCCCVRSSQSGMNVDPASSMPSSPVPKVLTKNKTRGTPQVPV